MSARDLEPPRKPPESEKLTLNLGFVDLGLRYYSIVDLEAVRAAGEKLAIRVLGLAVIAPDVSPELAAETIDSVHVLGALQASAAVRSALAGRIR